MPEQQSRAARPQAAVVQGVLDVVRVLARATGGPRAERAVHAQASLARDLGLGSLERVELLLRLESAFECTLADGCLELDTPAALAEAVLEARPSGGRPTTSGEPSHVAAAPLGSVATLQESLWRRAEREPEREHVLLREPERADEIVSYGRLRDEAAAIAGGLRSRGVVPGDTVALMLPTGLDFLRTFMGTLAARAIPVPIYPPLRLDRLAEYAERQSAILADAGVKLLVTVSRARPVATLLRASLPTLAEVVTAEDLVASGAPFQDAAGLGSDAALIQYTSGSTGRPKGVLLTHDNLLANLRALAAGLALAPTDVGVSWLPLYHDMGLIGSWLLCLHHAVPLTLLPPTAFLARPERWLWTIHERRATLSAAPNFAYELVARRLPDAAIEGLDLSSWRVALNGAEPVSPATLDRFAARFGPCGFRRQALLPVYGLAECAVGLSFPPLGRGPRVDRVSRVELEHHAHALPAAPGDAEAATISLVSVGRELPEHEVRIVDDAGHDLGERSVGRLVFRGPSATSGYYRNPEATASITLPGGWLDSGDLAYRADGEIHVCGRRKDLIIKGGRNIAPQEIEEAAADVAGIRRGCVVAFGVPSAALGTESLVVVAETRLGDPEARERLVGAVIAHLAEALDVPPDEVVLVAPGTVPKTSSGKLRRSAAREQFLAGSLAAPSGPGLAQRLRLLAALAREPLARAAARVARAILALWLAATLPPLLIAAWLLVLLVPSRRLAGLVSRLGSRGALFLVGCRLEVSGLDHLPRQGPLVLASNHASYVDIAVLLALLPFDLVFVAKREVLSNPFLRAFVRRAGHLTVERWDAQQSLASAQAVTAALGRGARVVFFPEGTFTSATGLRPFRLGAFKAAAAAGVPVVPLALSGTRKVMRGEWKLPRPARVRLAVLSALTPQGTGLAELAALRDRVRNAIAAECGEPRLDLLAAGPADSPAADASPTADGAR